MVNHTMIVSFDQPIPAGELDQFLTDIERVMLGPGNAQTFAARRHVPVPGEEAVPALVATAIVRLGFADADVLTASFSAPGVAEVIHRWQARYPYKVAWANHEAL